MAGKAKAEPKPLSVEDVAGRAHVLSVFGPFNSSALVMMPTDLAEKIWPDGLGAAARPDPVEAIERDLDAIRQRAPHVADSALAASAVTMAYELIDPFNSATSKSMCARAMHDALEKLRELCPPAEEDDELDRIKSRLAPGADRESAA